MSGAAVTADYPLVVWLAATFYYDHLYRDLPAGEVVRATQQRVLVRLTEEEAREVYSDASHYATDTGDLRADYPHLVASAKRVVIALRRVGVRVLPPPMSFDRGPGRRQP